MNASSTQSTKPAKSSAFTLIELMTVIAIIGILAAITIPILSNVRVSARKAQCVANLRSIGQGFAIFLQDNKDRYPGNGPGGDAPGGTNGGSLRWDNRIAVYMDLGKPLQDFNPGTGQMIRASGYAHNEAVFHCPVTKPEHYKRTGGTGLWSLGGYGVNTKIVPIVGTDYNIFGLSASQIPTPSRTVLVIDRYAGGGAKASEDESRLSGITLSNFNGPYPSVINGPSANHRSDQNPATGKGICNMLFCDGHVEGIELASINPWPSNKNVISRIIFFP